MYDYYSHYKSTSSNPRVTTTGILILNNDVLHRFLKNNNPTHGSITLTNPQFRNLFYTNIVLNDRHIFNKTHNFRWKTTDPSKQLGTFHWGGFHRKTCSRRRTSRRRGWKRGVNHLYRMTTQLELTEGPWQGLDWSVSISRKDYSINR